MLGKPYKKVCCSVEKICEYFLLFSIILLFISCGSSSAESMEVLTETSNNGKQDNFKVIAYWTGSNEEIDKETVLQLDQIIYSFLHLKGNSLNVKSGDSIHLNYLSSLKKINPNLKVLVSLGGWGGCNTCSDVFSTAEGRTEFSRSVDQIMEEYGTDGIDLDWEYPAIEGPPGHSYKPDDRVNFTSLVKELRSTLGPDYVISFAAGASRDYLVKSVEWKKVMPLLDHVNIMSYDMFNGGSPMTGHHTSLYSTSKQKLSTDGVIKYLDSLGIPSKKMVIAAAFYARVWEEVNSNSNGLYSRGKFKESVLYKDLDNYMEKIPGFHHYWDSVAQASYSYNAEASLFATYDDSLSVAKKTNYAINKNLGGIMFWRLSGDKSENGLLDVIDKVRKNN